MIFVPNHLYRRPRPTEVPPGEPCEISASTVHVAHDARGREVGYLIDQGVGSQRAQEAAR